MLNIEHITKLIAQLELPSWLAIFFHYLIAIILLLILLKILLLSLDQLSKTGWPVVKKIIVGIFSPIKIDIKNRKIVCFLIFLTLFQALY